MLISGVRPVREVEPWWQWMRPEPRREYDAFLAHVASRHGPVQDPLCCQFIGLVAPRTFMASYADIDEPELGFLEYKIPVYAQVFGIPLVPTPASGRGGPRTRPRRTPRAPRASCTPGAHRSGFR
jgi:hypothetical protein